jgi:hypothetical protein
VNTSHAVEEGAHSPSWLNGLIIIEIIVNYKLGPQNETHTLGKDAHSPSWPNELINIIITIIIIILGTGIANVCQFFRNRYIKYVVRIHNNNNNNNKYAYAGQTK